METITLDQARAIALTAQGFGQQLRAVDEVIARVGAVQLDTISVLARSHELVPRARTDASTLDIHTAYWNSGTCFEYWSHAASILPMSSWPIYAFRRRRSRERYSEDLAELRGERQRVVRRLRNEGPLTATELGGAKVPGEWWSWSTTKHVLELLLATGQVAVTSRSRWRRIYALADQVIPESDRHDRLSDRQCLTQLVEEAGRQMGIATLADLADYPRIKQVDVKAALPRTSLLPVRVAGWSQPAWLHPQWLAVDQVPEHPAVLLSPFDSLIWSRARTERLFDYRHRLEIYVPKAQREHGYFTTPVLARGRIVGIVDPKRDGSRLLVRKVVPDSRHRRDVEAAVLRAAEWVGADEVIDLS